LGAGIPEIDHGRPWLEKKTWSLARRVCGSSFASDGIVKRTVLFSEAAIAARVAELAHHIRGDIPGPDLAVIGLLTGSFMFVADLVRALARLGVEPLVDFMAVSHYGSATAQPGVALIRRGVDLNVRNRTVLVVDDILDSGYTLRVARDHLAARAPQWLRTCVLLDKPARRVVDVMADYVGFEVPDVWIIGYGLDAQGEGRALPYVAAVESGTPEHGKE
jgi:hypoxanthine phosphoribosyltransferase